MKVTDFIARDLYRRGVRTVFELSGGMITHLLNSFYEAQQLRIISMHHEQAAAFAADATGRITGIPGVAMATSGPGATNLLTGIGSCYFDSSPAVFITGQVNRWELKKDRHIRQLGFQETDIVSMAKPITKAAWQVNSPEEVPAMMADAFSLAMAGRPGPVLIDIPMDIQRSNLEESVHVQKPSCTDESLAPFSDASVVDKLLIALKNSSRPLILAGGGIRAGNAVEALRRFAVTTGIPVVNSLLAVDLLACEDPLRVGMIGSYGNRWANLALAASDLLIVLGSRLDIRQTGSDTEFLAANRTIFHIDCEAGEINNRVCGCHAIVSEVKPFIEVAEKKAKSEVLPGYAQWAGEINILRKRYPDLNELENIKGINPNRFMHQLSSVSGMAGAYVVDVGQHQMWAAQSIDVKEGQRWLTSGGMGSMGFALPAAIATAINVGRPVVMIAGDGAFQCNIQELQTVVRNGLPLKIVIMNNRCHGMVRQFQESYFDGHYQSTLWGYDAPDFVQIATAYGMTGSRVETACQVDEGLGRLWENPAAPALLEVMIDTFTNVYPKIAFGRPLSEMEPDSKPIDMEGT